VENRVEIGRASGDSSADFAHSSGLHHVGAPDRAAAASVRRRILY